MTEIQLPHERVGQTYCEDQQGGRKAPARQQKDRDQECQRSQPITAGTIRLDELRQGNTSELQTKPELHSAHNAMRNPARKPIQRSTKSKDQHDQANRQPATVELLGRCLLGDDEGRHSFQRLHRHRHAIQESSRDLEHTEDDENTCPVQASGQTHPYQERNVRAGIAERTGDLVATEPSSLGHGYLAFADDHFGCFDDRDGPRAHKQAQTIDGIRGDHGTHAQLGRDLDHDLAHDIATGNLKDLACIAIRGAQGAQVELGRSASLGESFGEEAQGIKLCTACRGGA